MSLLKTTQSTDNGVLRLTSYHRSRRDAATNGTNHAVGLLDLSSRSSQQQQHTSELSSATGIYTTSTTTDEELHTSLGHAHLVLGDRMSSGESRDLTEESVPTMSRTSGSNASSFSISRAFSPQQSRYATPPRRQTPPPPSALRSPPSTLRSPSKSFDSNGSKKISLNDPMSLQSMSVGKVQIQNAPLSPNHRSSSLSPARRRARGEHDVVVLRRSPSTGAIGSLEKVDALGNTITQKEQPKSEAYQRASKLLKKVDASKQAAEKVERAREEARRAIEKARKAKAASSSSQSTPTSTPKSTIRKKKRTIRFSDQPQDVELESLGDQEEEEDAHQVEEISIPKRSDPYSVEELSVRQNSDPATDELGIPTQNSEPPGYAMFAPLHHDDDDDSTEQDRYGVDEANSRYEVDNAEHDVIDDILDLEASKKRARQRILAGGGKLPPLSPPRKEQDDTGDDLNDLMNLAESMLIGNVGPVSTVTNSEQQQELAELDECITDACSDLGCGSDIDHVGAAAKAEAANKPMSPTKRYPMPQNPAVLERVLEDKGIQATPPPSPPPEVMDSVAYRVQKASNGRGLRNEGDLGDDAASHEDELDDIMNFAAGLLGSKSDVQSPHKEKKKEKGKVKSPTEAKPEATSSVPEDVGRGDELDDIMDFAASLLGSKQPGGPPPKAPPASSIVESVQMNQAVPNKPPAKVEESSCCNEACSVWKDEFFPSLEKQGTAEGAEKPSLLYAATNSAVPPPPEAFNLKPVPSLADDLTGKTSPSADVHDLLYQNDAFNKPSAAIGVTTVDDDDEHDLSPEALLQEQRNETPIHPVPEEGKSEGDNKSSAPSEKQSKAGTILDNNDAYWDTLSTIASNSKDMSINRISHPHQPTEQAVPNEAIPTTLDSLHEGAPFSAILCGWLGMEQRNGAPKRLNQSAKAGETHGETHGDTFALTEGSIIPKIPTMIEYPAQPLDDAKGEMPAQTEMLNTVETLITKGSSNSSSSRESFYLQNGLSSFVEASEQDVDKAIVRGEKMASPASPTTSRYGDDKGDEPLGSPSFLSHDSKSTRATPNSRRNLLNEDARSPKSPPKGQFLPINDELDRLETADSELAAMLGIKKVTSPDETKDDVTSPEITKDGKAQEQPYGYVSGSHSHDSSFGDLLMVLTRSAGDDEAVEGNPRGALSPPVEDILLSLKRAETMGHDDDSVEMVSSPQSSSRKGFKPEDKLPLDTKKQQDSDSQLVQKDASCSIIDVLFDDEEAAPYSGMQQLEKAQKEREQAAAAAVTPKAANGIDVLFDEVSMPQSGIQQLEKANEKQQQAMNTPLPLSPKKDTPPVSPKKKATKQAIDVLLKDDKELTWAEKNAAANAASAKEFEAQKHLDSHINQGDSCPVVPVFFDDDESLPNANVQQLENAQRKREGAERAKASPTKSPKKQDTQVVGQETSCPPMFGVPKMRPREYVSPTQSDDDEMQVVMSPTDNAVKLSQVSAPPVRAPRVSPTKTRPQEYVSPTQSDDDDGDEMQVVMSPVSPTQSDEDEDEDDEMQVVMSSTDNAVRLSPVKELRVTPAAAKNADEISDVSSKQSFESKTKVMSELLSKYDNIIDQLISEKSNGNKNVTPTKSGDVSMTLTELREEKKHALSLPSRRDDRQDPRSKSPRKRQESKSPPKAARDKQFTSNAIGKASPTRSPRQSAQRTPSSRAGVSPTRSPLRSSQQSMQPLVTKSPTRSPRRPTKSSVSLSRDKAPSTRSPSRYVSPTRPTREYSSPSSSSSRVNASQPSSSMRSSQHRTSRSPTRSPRRQRSTIQSRDVSTPTRSAGIQSRVSAPSPRRSTSSGRTAPRPEDKIQEMRRRRAESLSPPKHRRSDPYGRRGSAEYREPAVPVVKRVYSPVRQRYSRSYDPPDIQLHHSFTIGESSSDESSEYGKVSRKIQRELNLARHASESIQHSHDELFDELEVFQDKLLRHSRRKEGEREFIIESRNAMNDFQHRLECVREAARETKRSGRETPDTLEQVEQALEDAWGDFDNVRGSMLNNLRMLNEAKEELMRERLYRAEEHDEEQLHMLENMIADIRQSSRIHRHSRRSQGRSPYVSTDRSKYGRSRSAPRPRDLAAGYSPRDPLSRYSARGRPNFVPGERRAGYSPSTRSQAYSRTNTSTSRYGSYR